MIFRFVRTSKINSWLTTNYPASIQGTPGDNWKKFLSDNGGTGSTFHDLEASYLASKGTFGGTIHDRWSSFVNANGFTNGVYLDRMRAYFEGVISTPGGVTSFFFFNWPK